MVTKEQIDCSGHDWDTWDKDQNTVYYDVCQSCWVKIDDWVEYLEDNNMALRDVLGRMLSVSSESRIPSAVREEAKALLQDEKG